MARAFELQRATPARGKKEDEEKQKRRCNDVMQERALCTIARACLRAFPRARFPILAFSRNN